MGNWKSSRSPGNWKLCAPFPELLQPLFLFCASAMNIKVQAFQEFKRHCWRWLSVALCALYAGCSSVCRRRKTCKCWLQEVTVSGICWSGGSSIRVRRECYWGNLVTREGDYLLFVIDNKICFVSTIFIYLHQKLYYFQSNQINLYKHYFKIYLIRYVSSVLLKLWNIFQRALNVFQKIMLSQQSPIYKFVYAYVLFQNIIMNIYNLEL